MMCVSPNDSVTYNVGNTFPYVNNINNMNNKNLVHPPGFSTPKYNQYNHYNHYSQYNQNNQYKKVKYYGNSYYTSQKTYPDINQDYPVESVSYQKKKTSVFCANCGGYGHVYKTCNHPIISYGVICYKNFYDKTTNSIYPKYLMVQRKDSLCYVEFIRGKYSLNNKEYLMKLFSHMTEEERVKLGSSSFEALWNFMWCRGKHKYDEDSGSDIATDDSESSSQDGSRARSRDAPSEGSCEGSREGSREVSKEECNTRNFNKEWKEAADKFNMLKQGYYIITTDDKRQFFDLEFILKNTHSIYNETEWGFPKGRRNINEDDVTCAVREFKEETGVPTKNIKVMKDVKPLEEVFTGSNNIRYKHVYYVAKFNQLKSEYGSQNNMKLFNPKNFLQNKEVRDVQWFTYQEAQEKIRESNMERKELFKRLNQLIIKNYQYT
jgi:8-oxo-dGTP pyrophosphatase MutT (NUDIX family)